MNEFEKQVIQFIGTWERYEVTGDPTLKPRMRELARELKNTIAAEQALRVDPFKQQQLF